ncbi:MAG: HAMP domain-containing protein [Thermoanaerobaculales bacterium]|nr:HAMP domain-containing protein [Thermoanaerobaculales bacterium]
MLRSIAGKLALLLTVTLAVIFGVSAWHNLRIQERSATEISLLNATQLADVLVGATREAMLHNDREAIQATMDTLAGQRDIERIRFIKKRGQIAFSTDRSEIGTVLEMRTEQCIACHQKVQPPEVLPTRDRARIIVRNDHRFLGVTQTIRNEPACSNSGCHVHRPEDRLLGVLDINLDLGPSDKAHKESANELLISSLLGILGVVIVTLWSVRRMVHRPVRKLIKESKKLADGDLGARVPEVSNDELGILAKTFNNMAMDLENARGELIEWGQTLETRVDEKTGELSRAQDQIIQVERMASLGKLAAVVAHEINNPLASVVTYAKIIVRRLNRQGELTDECSENLEYLGSIVSEASRCGEIVSQLLAFARRRGGEFGPADVNQIVEKALFLINHQLEMNGIETKIELQSDLPSIIADQAQIQQALMALLINATQALDDGEKITLITRSTDRGVEIAISDTGPGMSADVARHAFEPFFTTKDQGDGVGLGLSVVYGIVERHGGNIDLETAPGEGCRFTLFLPNKPPQRGEEIEP